MAEPELLRWLLHEALDPGDRFPSATLLPTLMGRLDETPKRRWRGDWAASLAAVLIALFAVGTFLFIRSPHTLRTSPATTPQGTSFSPSFQTAADWYGPAAPVMATTDSTLSGSIHIRPSGSGDYVIEPVVRDASDHQVRTLSLTLVHGRCSEFTASPARLISASDPLVPWIQSKGGSIWIWPVARVQASVVSSPLVVFVREGDGSAACADVPVVEAVSLQPRAGATPAVATFRPAASWKVTGALKVWPTSGGDFLLTIDATSAESDSTFRPALPLWHVATGSCSQQSGSQTVANIGQVLARFNYPVNAPGRQSFSLVLPANWSGQPLILAAFVQGGGPLIGCATIPKAAA
jgi:hypothetical protein